MDEQRKCVICGNAYTPTAYNQQRCADCARANRLRCEVCGTVFTSPAYAFPGYRRMCNVCLNKFRGEINTHAAHIQSDAAREKARAARSAASKTTVLAAQAAMKTHPRTAAGSLEHAHAKVWRLRDPDGRVCEVTNLMAFIAEHPDQFPKPAAAKVAFVAMARTLREPEGNFKHRYSCMGWTLDAPPEYTEETQERRDYIRLKEARRRERRASGASGYKQPVDADQPEE